MKAERIPVEQFEVRLTMTAQEASLLHQIIGKVGGTGDGRVFVDALFHALGELPLPHTKPIYIGYLNADPTVHLCKPTP